MKRTLYRLFGSALLVAAVLALAAGAACSSSDGETTTIDQSASDADTAMIRGTVGGVSFKAQTAIARSRAVTVTNADGTTSSMNGIEIVVSDAYNSCEGLHLQGATLLSITLPATTPSVNYAVADPGTTGLKAAQAQVDFDALDDTCHDRATATATGGTVTLNGSVPVLTSDGGPGPANTVGNISATFGSGSIQGYFIATICPDDDTAVAPLDDVGSPSACQP